MYRFYKKLNIAPTRALCRVVASFFCLIFLDAAMPNAPQAQGEMIFAVQPYLPAEEIRLRYEPLVRYLSETSRLKIILRVGRDYNHHIEYIGKGKVDLAFIGPAPYIRLTEKYGKHPILARLQTQGTWYYQGRIVTRIDSDIESIYQVRGKRFAFGDQNSTMSSLVPRYMLYQAGIDLRDLAKFDHLGSHENVALGILTGDYDAGAIKAEVYQTYAARGLKVIATTPPIPEHIIIARKGLPVKTRDIIQQALFSLVDSKEGQAILLGIKGTTTEVATAKDSDYDELRKIMDVVQGAAKSQ